MGSWTPSTLSAGPLPPLCRPLAWWCARRGNSGPRACRSGLPEAQAPQRHVDGDAAMHLAGPVAGGRPRGGRRPAAANAADAVDRGGGGRRACACSRSLDALAAQVRQPGSVAPQLQAARKARGPRTPPRSGDSRRRRRVGTQFALLHSPECTGAGGGRGAGLGSRGRETWSWPHPRRPAVAETASPSDAAGDRRGGPGGNRWLTPRASARQMLRRMLDLAVPVHAGASSERRATEPCGPGLVWRGRQAAPVTFSVG